MNTTKVDYQNIAFLLNTASWRYVHCGDRINEKTMEDLINAISSYTITAEDVANCDDGNRDDYNEADDLEKYLAYKFADPIAQRIVECPYRSVTFIAAI